MLELPIRLSGYIGKDKLSNIFIPIKRNIKSGIKIVLTRLEGDIDIFIKGYKESSFKINLPSLSEIKKFK